MNCTKLIYVAMRLTNCNRPGGKCAMMAAKFGRDKTTWIGYPITLYIGFLNRLPLYVG